jgi:hypothetical protein
MNRLRNWFGRVVCGGTAAETATALRVIARAAWALMFLGCAFAFALSFVLACYTIFEDTAQFGANTARSVLYAAVTGVFGAAEVFLTLGLACGFLWFYAAWFAKAAEKLQRPASTHGGDGTDLA